MTINSPVSFTRRHILGPMHAKCDPIDASIPLFLDDEKSEPIGHVDQGLGPYRDAFSFHVEDSVCKRLAAGHYRYGLDLSEGESGRVSLVSITLYGKTNYEKPLPRLPRGSSSADVKSA